MPLNFPTNPSTNDTYVYQGATYVFDGTRWKLNGIEYSYTGETVASNTSIVTLDLSKGNVFDITSQVENVTIVEFSTPPSEVQSFSVKIGADDFYSSSYDLVNASYDNVSFSVAAQDTSPLDFAFKPDGTKMYVVGNSSDRVYQYTLSTPWSISTASYDSVSFSVAAQETNPYDLAFKPDGTKMYMVGITSDTVYQYTLATAWDLSTASYDSVSFSVDAQDGLPVGISFKPDGTKMYILGFTNDTVYQYSLSTPWNISSASYDSVSFSVAAQDVNTFAISFRPDGTKMYVLGDGTDTLYQYSLSTPWNISSASYDSVSFSVAAQDAAPANISFKPDGTKMYVIGLINDRVYQYTTTTATPSIVWPTNIKWENGTTAPAAPDRGSDSIYYFTTSDGGTTYYGKVSTEDLF